MSIVRWRLINALDCTHTYGYITKANRITLCLEKSHANDAFVIAGGTNQVMVDSIGINQYRRNNRCLAKFYDAKYLDIRTGKKASGQDLSSGRRTRNKSLSGENLRKYRGHKLSRGRQSIRVRRYFYQPKDLVIYEGDIHRVVGTQNKGKYIKLDGVKKVPKVGLVKPYKFNRGLCVA